MNGQEAILKAKKAKIKSLRRDLEATQDVLNNWDEGNLDSIEGVYAHDSVGTATSAAS